MHPLLVRLSVLSLAVGITSYNINRVVPDPYLDEVFHIPQAQAYCRNAFHVWDPKLTTPAGLYLLSYPLNYLNLCTPPFLRAINAFGVAFLLPVIVYRIQQTLHGKGQRQDEASAQIAVNVALFPLVYFFGGLFYTDVWSTVFVMAAYLATLREKRWVAGVFAWVALWFRQTNVVWVVFMAGVYAVRRLEGMQEDEAAKRGKQAVKGLEVGMLLDLRRWGEVRIHNLPVNEDTTVAEYILTLTTLLPAILRNLPALLVAVIPYIIVLLSFALFLALNNFTIVLGDASAHQASLHVPQLLYLAAFTAFFSFPLYLPLLPSFISSSLPPSPKTILSLLVAVAASATAVYTNTLLHPYLLADNRHYAFYVFRRLLLRFPPYSLFAPIPLYIAAAWLQFRTASINTSWCLLYVFATTATLVGAPLVEPRYFVVAWVVWRMHIREGRVWVLRLEAMWFVVVNVVTLWLFLERSFEWPQEPGARQRFMW